MQPNFPEKFTKAGLKFCLWFAAFFAALYFLFQMPFLQQATQGFVKGSLDPFLAATLPKIETMLDYDRSTNPPLLKIRYFSKAELEEKKREADRSGLKKVDIKLTTNSVNLDTYQFGQVYFPFFIALFLATPLAFQKRALAFMLGAVMYWLLVLLVYRFKVLFFVASKKIGVYEYDGWMMGFLNNVHEISKAGFFSILIIVVWFFSVIVVYRKGDFGVLGRA